MAITVSIWETSKTENSISVAGSFSSGGTQAHYYRFFKNGVGDSSLTSITPSTSVTKYHTYSGLASSTSYNLTVHYYDVNVVSLGSSSVSITTNAPPSPTNITNLSATGASKSQINLSWTHASTREGYNIYRNNVYVGYTTSNSYSDTGLSEFTDYTYTVKSTYSGSESSGVSVVGKTLDQTAPIISMSSGYPSKTATSITLKWTSSDAHSGIQFHRAYIGTSYNQLSATTKEHTFNNLTTGQTYTVYVTIADNQGNTAQTTQYSVTLDGGRPENWSWSTSKTSGTTFNLTAIEWNNFCTRINDFRAYKGLSSYSFTAAVSGTNALASQINQARTAINDMSPPTTVPVAVSSNTNCLPSTVNGLRDSLNSIT